MAELGAHLDLQKDFPLWVVEDDEAQLSLVKLLTEQLSPLIKVKGFTSGKALLNELEKSASLEKVPVILSDLHLSDMTGFELLEAVRKNNFFNASPFLFLTGTESTDTKNKAYRLGASAYLVKPFDLGEFKQLLKSLISFWAHA